MMLVMMRAMVTRMGRAILIMRFRGGGTGERVGDHGNDVGRENGRGNGREIDHDMAIVEVMV